MTNVEQIIHSIKELPNKDKKQAAYFLVQELEDQDAKEDIEFAIQEYEEWKRTGEASSAEEVFSRLGVE